MKHANLFADASLAHAFIPSDDGIIVDNFAGGGGASTGIEAALGRAIDIAINHDEQALRMHAANHPGTVHIRNNIYRVDPREVAAGRRVRLAWFSPDCKHFSKAKGGKPREKSIRDLAWVVVHWAQLVKPDLILLENVEEFRTWGPLDDQGYPIKARAGETFDQWCKALRKQGYKLQFKELRACDYGAPTIRKRFFMIARCDGQPIVWPEPTHGKPGSPEVVSGKRLPWRTAAEIIDWSIPCPSIFDRKKPLAEKTLRRIAHGIMKFVVNNPSPFIVPAMTNNTAKSTDDPLSTVTASNRLWLAQPFVAPLTHAGSAGRSYGLDIPLHTVTGANRGEMGLIVPHITKFRAGAVGHGADEPLHTITANSFIKRPGVSAPLGLVEVAIAPVVVGTAFKNTRAARAFEPEEPLRTQTAQAEYAIATAHLSPFVTYAQQGGANRSAEDPIHTITASQKDQNCIVTALLSPVIIGCGGRRGQSAPVGPEQPYPTTTAKADACIATAHLVHIGNGERQGQAPRAMDITKPLGTVVAGGVKHHAVTAFLAPFYGEKANGKVRSSNAADEPLRTQTCDPRHSAVVAHLAQFSETREGRKPNPGHSMLEPVSTIVQRGPLQALVSAHIAQMNEERRGVKPGRSAEDPVSTITTSGSHQQIVTSNLMKLRGTSDAHIEASAEPVDEPLHTISAQGTHMAEVRAFLIKYYGNEQSGHGLADPLGTVTVQDRFGLVTVTIDGEEYVIVDIGMRMLTPRELFNAQGFPPDYIIDRDADGRPITKTAQVAKCGNSVCPPLAEALVRANMADAVAERVAA